MSEKQFVLYEHKGDYYILKNPRLHLDFIEMLGDALTSEEIVEELNQLDDKVVELSEENEQLRKIGVMYQGHNPCETCTYCFKTKMCWCFAEPIPTLCDDAKKNFIQGLCKKHKQFQKSIRGYDDE